MFILILIGGYYLINFGLDTFYQKAYPIKYNETVLAESKNHDLPIELVCAVIHTESRFNPDAVSSIGARGLMQLTEDTFDFIAFRKKDTEHTYDDMFDPKINIEYGTYLLRLLIDEFGSIDNALCAYHAGWGSATKWLSDKKYSSDGITIDNIPFGDTKAYVEKVNKTMAYYKQIATTRNTNLP